MLPLIAAAIAAPIIGGLVSKFGQDDANAQNRQMSDAQMQFQERMSSTAHQRQVEDLRAAGLNPLLSANSGASSPAGAMAKAENSNAQLGAGLTASAKDAIGLYQTQQTVESQVATNKAQQEMLRTQAVMNQANAKTAITENAIKSMEGQAIKAGLQEKIRLAPANEWINSIERATGAAANVRRAVKPFPDVHIGGEKTMPSRSSSQKSVSPEGGAKAIFDSLRKERAAKQAKDSPTFPLKGR